MKKIILLLIIFISNNISSQSLKGEKKWGGVQEGKPFSIIYSNHKVGTYNESTVSFPLSQSYDSNSTIFFNFNNSNNKKLQKYKNTNNKKEKPIIPVSLNI